MIYIIAARDKFRVIGQGGGLPDWKLKADMRRFKELTTNNVVVMGRATYESIGRPLPNRYNIVISSLKKFFEPGWLTTSTDYSQAMSLAEQVAEARKCDIYIIGGEAIYQQALADMRVSKLLITLVNGELAGDKHFPATPISDWKLTTSELHAKDDDNSHDYAFLEYLRLDEYDLPREIFYYPSSRSAEQTDKMLEIENSGICPFCSQWLEWYHDSPILHHAKHWTVTHNDNPYYGTLIDLLLISAYHCVDFRNLPIEAQRELGEVIGWVEARYQLEFFGFAMRVGPVQYVSGSVNHLHAHIKVGDVFHEDHQPIRFKLSSKPEINKPPETYH